MTSTATLAAIRFGTGLAPDRPAPNGAAGLLAEIDGPDTVAAAFPQEGFVARWEAAQAVMAARRAARQDPDDAALEEAFRALRREVSLDRGRQLATMLARGIAAPTGFRERLAWFWADHFTVTGAEILVRGTHTGYIEDAIRPHLAGRFADLLRAAILHPAMLIYLDQARSIGPNSPAGLNREEGLNENLAREVLELHTLGADGAYTQDDVRQMAELLTGAVVDRGEGTFAFRPRLAEPGPETVLGQSFGGDPARAAHVEAALEMLATHPDTARHIAAKLARHFVSETPEPSLIDAMTEAFLATDGNLRAVYVAMLDHPQAWAAELTNVKWPFEVLASALRALEVDPAALVALRPPVIRQMVALPLEMMGQAWHGALGPDGFEEADAAWTGAQGLAARIGWAMVVPERLARPLPDPRAFVVSALADAAPPELTWAVERAATRSEGVGLVLASPAFQRR